MIDKLRKMLELVDADYADIRYENKKETSIWFEGKELTRVSANSADGYVLRVLSKGGFSSVAFTKPEDAGRAAAAALADAKLLSRNVRESVRLAGVPVIKARFRPEMSEHPEKVSLEEKIALTRAYNGIPLKNPKVITTSIAYVETCRDKYFASTEGTEINEELATLSLAGTGTARDGALTQSALFLTGGSDGFSCLRNREDYFEKNSKFLTDMLSAKPVAGGVYNVILDQGLAGTFTHEAFGHFSEADLVEDMPELRKKMSIGAQLGSGSVNIVDDPTLPHQLGFYKYDDEGVPAKRVQLMKNGVLAGRLHSRRTAAAFGDEATGHCVAEDYRYEPIVRMGSIMIEPDPATDFEKLLSQLGNGLYLCGSKGGQTSGENFTFSAAWGFEVKNGKIGQMLRDINIMGNMFTTLKNIAAVGNDPLLSEFGGCGKGQINRRSCHGGPHILVNSVVVGGVK
jgi:TldD protein